MSLLVGVCAVVLSSILGVTLGLLSGFFAGRVDTVLMTVVDITLSFSALLLALAFAAALGPNLKTVILVPGLTGWERCARVVRADVLALRERDFVEAARAMAPAPRESCSGILANRAPASSRIVLRHMLPNTVSNIIVLATLQIAQALLQEAGLSSSASEAEAATRRGQMIAQGTRRRRGRRSRALRFSSILSMNLIGDRLRDALDPRAT